MKCTGAQLQLILDFLRAAHSGQSAITEAIREMSRDLRAPTPERPSRASSE